MRTKATIAAFYASTVLQVLKSSKMGTHLVLILLKSSLFFPLKFFCQVLKTRLHLWKHWLWQDFQTSYFPGDACWTWWWWIFYHLSETFRGGGKLKKQPCSKIIMNVIIASPCHFRITAWDCLGPSPFSVYCKPVQTTFWRDNQP